jgi:hypothetical protein
MQILLKLMILLLDVWVVYSLIDFATENKRDTVWQKISFTLNIIGIGLVVTQFITHTKLLF